MIGDLVLGVRMALGNGRTSVVRLALVALGVGLGVAVLLAATSVPHLLDARGDRGAARVIVAADHPVPGVDPAYLIQRVDEFRGRGLQGYLVQPTGPRAPHAPGVDRLPGPGEAVLSPALQELLASPEGETLRPRFPHHVIGTIGDAGLTGPNELYFYLGSATVAQQPSSVEVSAFGVSEPGRPLTALELLLVVLGAVTCVIPIAVFVVTSTRLAAVARDRRLAALRLVGADAGQVRRIAAGEALVGAFAGLLVGIALFAIVRALVPEITLSAFRGGIFSEDVLPDWRLGVPALITLPALAAAVAVLALRGVVIEPLGVVRRAGRARRKLWWRVLPVLAGVGLLATRFGRDARSPLVIAGIAVLLVAVPLLLPWLVESAARLLGGGSPAWQLAVRRLQLDSGSAARVVSGVAVVIAGTIALQTVYAAAESDTPRSPTSPVMANAFTVSLPETEAFAAGIHALPGASRTPVRVGGRLENAAGVQFPITVGSCGELRLRASIPRCADGDVFSAGAGASGFLPTGGERVWFEGARRLNPAVPEQWTIPADVPEVAALGGETGLLVTPAALRTATGVALYSNASIPDASPDQVEQVRNVVGRLGWSGTVYSLGTGVDGTHQLITRVLGIGSVIVLLLAAASLMVVALEQMRERRRSLAVLLANGAPRAVLARSLLWQAAIPVMLAVAVAVGVGLGLAALLLVLVVERPVVFDWTTVALLAGTAVAGVLLVTGMTLPSLWRDANLDQLRED